MLRIENLGVRFGQTELFSGINLHVAKGDFICLTGPSGCGKTTLLRAVMGFVAPFEGSIRGYLAHSTHGRPHPPPHCMDAARAFVAN